MSPFAVRTMLSVGVALGALASQPALAQDGEAQAADANELAEAGDDEIVVTARRREESLLDVPIAITAYSGEALERQGAIDITDLSDTTPNVTLENTRGTNNSLSAFIRGVGQQDPVGGFEAGVGIYLDDVYLNRPQAAVLDIYDVERIEILRGPQGTLYGRNTIGGAVKYVTRRLPEDFEVKARATYGTYDQAEAVISASVPLGDFFKLGGSFARLSRGGFGDNLTLAGVENYNKDVWAGRATVEFETPDDRLLIRIAGDYTKDESDPRNGFRLIPGLLSGAPLIEDEYDTRAGLALPTQEVEAYGLSMNISADLGGDFTFRSISGWRDDRSSTPIDFDALPAVDVDVPAIYDNSQISQEFQLLYEGDRLQGLIGAYYLDAEARTTFDVRLSTTVPGLNAFTDGDVKTETWSVFGDFIFDVTRQIAVSVGGRYTHDERNALVFRQTLLGPSAPFGGTPIVLATTSNFRGESTFKEFTPRGSISFKPTEDHLLYASYAKGFKGGGFDPRGLSSAAPDLDGDGVSGAQGDQDDVFEFFDFAPEKVDSYEIGYKGSLFDNRVRLALTGFYADYKNVQIPGSAGFDSNGDGTNDTFVGVTNNAAKAEIKGVEAELFAALARDFAGPSSSINFTGTLGYVDAKFKEYITNVPGVGPVDVADFRKVQNTPEWTLSGTLGAAIPVGGGRIDASTTVSYRSKTFQFEIPSEFLDQPGYALWDASLVYTFDDDRFFAGVHAKNIADKRYITSGYQFLSTDPRTGAILRNPTTGNPIPTLGREGIATVFYGNPRQVFATVGVKF